MAKGQMFQTEIKPPFRDAAGRFTKATEQLLRDHRTVVQNVGRWYVAIAKQEAPSKTGEFKNSIGYRTQVIGQSIKLEVVMMQPLGDWIIKGTKRHPIVGNPILRFFWQKGPDGPGIYYFRRVMHPGTKPNRFNERAWKKARPYAEDQLRKIGRDWVTRVT